MLISLNVYRLLIHECSPSFPSRVKAITQEGKMYVPQDHISSSFITVLWALLLNRRHVQPLFGLSQLLLSRDEYGNGARQVDEWRVREIVRFLGVTYKVRLIRDFISELITQLFSNLEPETQFETLIEFFTASLFLIQHSVCSLPQMLGLRLPFLHW
ncbi:hypothetical protein AVEN_1268-1 [Araneus ventricosus]|uniref:Uncharacterized protein n=1 Tax=Araneus ventricosus TaxID=182803 RepID=A0A4Y2QTV9_ARAVE|nr:hypothetical protein AVEN_1268-1 [Araneus ventricosus]